MNASPHHSVDEQLGVLVAARKHASLKPSTTLDLTLSRGLAVRRFVASHRLRQQFLIDGWVVARVSDEPFVPGIEGRDVAAGETAAHPDSPVMFWDP